MLLSFKSIAQKQSQFQNKRGFQFGYSLRAGLDFGESKLPRLRIGAGAGVGIFAISDILYPSANVAVIIFNGGFGSAKPLTNKPSWIADYIFSASLTGGFQNRMQFKSGINPANISYPLYFFTEFARPSLENPFNYSLTLGTNFIYRNRPSHKFQTVGFGNLHAWRLQLSYMNDGFPFQLIKLSDGRDRYYTGGGLISYHGKPNDYITLAEFSYHKFSGYTPNAFEASNLLDLAFVIYKDSLQTNYNKSKWTLTVANVPKNISLSISAFNHRTLDLQHKIHNSIFNAYHLVPHKPFYSVAIDGLYTATQLGMK